MQSYVEKLKPTMSDTWRADELYMKIGGNLKYVFALMDDQTRYWITQEVADTKYSHDARDLFHKGKELAGKKPMKIITDGLKSYHDVYKKEFFTIAKPRTVHEVSLIHNQHDNNKMKRLNGEIRQRERVMRGLKVKNIPILTGYQVYHNAIRLHEGLNSQTPWKHQRYRLRVKISGLRSYRMPLILIIHNFQEILAISTVDPSTLHIHNHDHM